MSAPLPLSVLLAGASVEETRTHHLLLATIAGFPASSWHEGSVPRTFFELEAIPYADLSRLVGAIASGGFLDYAERGWLDLVAQQLYNLQRKPSVYTQGTVRLTDEGSVGPLPVSAVGQLYLVGGGLRFRNITTGTLDLDGTLDLTFEAEYPGAAANLPDGTPLELVTTIPGITLATQADPGESWITQQGVDEESDIALRPRCRARWGELGYGATDLAYKFWALTASNEISRVGVAEATGDGRVLIYVAGPNGVVSELALAAAQTYVSARRPQCVRPTVANATAVTVAPTGIVKCRPGQTASAQAATAAVLASYYALLPLGPLIYRAPLERAILDASRGILNVALTNPAEQQLSAHQVAVPSMASLTFET